jgi:acyl carrier protein
MMMNMGEAIREVLDKHGRMSVSANSLSDDANLYDHGLSSHASVNVMLALEDVFGEEFPDSLLRKSTFQSVVDIREALVSMGIAADVLVDEEN